MASVLVTGAAGFIGRNVSRALIARGHSVLPVDDLSGPSNIPVDSGFLARGIADLLDSDLVGVDTVLHFAALKHVGRSFSDVRTLSHNADADHTLLSLVSRSQVSHVLVASSCEVYGDHGRIPIRESCPLSPYSPYAVSKCSLELLVNVFARLRTDQTFTVVRMFNTYGPDEYHDAVVPALVVQAIATRVLRIDGDGAQRRDYSYIDDVVRDIVSLTESPPAHRTLNIGSGSSHSVLDIASVLRAQVPGLDLAFRPARPNEVSGFVADTSLLRNCGAGARVVSLREGIGRCLDSPSLRQVASRLQSRSDCLDVTV